MRKRDSASSWMSSASTSKGGEIAGSIEWNAEKNVLAFNAVEVLPSEDEVVLAAQVSFEERSRGSWTPVIVNGRKYVETVAAAFTTDKAPMYIPSHNIQYSYPVQYQLNFYKDEYPSGYLKLRRGQAYLFKEDPEQWQQVGRFKGNAGEAVYFDYTYDEGNKGSIVQPTFKPAAFDDLCLRAGQYTDECAGCHRPQRVRSKHQSRGAGRANRYQDGHQRSRRRRSVNCRSKPSLKAISERAGSARWHKLNLSNCIYRGDGGDPSATVCTKLVLPSKILNFLIKPEFKDLKGIQPTHPGRGRTWSTIAYYNSLIEPITYEWISS
jgi:hypothetical protein